MGLNSELWVHLLGWKYCNGEMIRNSVVFSAFAASMQLYSEPNSLRGEQWWYV